mmetsp:Transcript_5526/g.17919  ORF Transcript_5526/g.17919 Transcript_5526/m.17919 type:complete len:342 (-) Transcript_5526:468-1493(-)
MASPWSTCAQSSLLLSSPPTFSLSLSLTNALGLIFDQLLQDLYNEAITVGRKRGEHESSLMRERERQVQSRGTTREGKPQPGRPPESGEPRAISASERDVDDPCFAVLLTRCSLPLLLTTTTHDRPTALVDGTACSDCTDLLSLLPHLGLVHPIGLTPAFLRDRLVTLSPHLPPPSHLFLSLCSAYLGQLLPTLLQALVRRTVRERQRHADTDAEIVLQSLTLSLLLSDDESFAWARQREQPRSRQASPQLDDAHTTRRHRATPSPPRSPSPSSSTLLDPPHLPHPQQRRRGHTKATGALARPARERERTGWKLLSRETIALLLFLHLLSRLWHLAKEFYA